MRDELVLIVPPDSESDHWSARQLLSSNFLIREQGSGSRRVVETALEKRGVKLRAFKRVMNLDSTEAIKSAVEAGLGIGFVSRWAILKELELGAIKVVDVQGLTVARHFSLVTRSGPELMGSASAFRLFALTRGGLLSSGPRKSVRAR
jgi:DNA-binding transcriptional LysR family regulator